MLVVNPSLPVNSVSELIAYAKANPGKLSFSSSGTGGGTHLAGELFNAMAGVKIQHVPYRGSAPRHARTCWAARYSDVRRWGPPFRAP